MSGRPIKRTLRGHGPAGQRVKELEREVRELKRANEILRKASAFFAQAELDRRPRLSIRPRVYEAEGGVECAWPR